MTHRNGRYTRGLTEQALGKQGAAGVEWLMDQLKDPNNADGNGGGGGSGGGDGSGGPATYPLPDAPQMYPAGRILHLVSVGLSPDGKLNAARAGKKASKKAAKADRNQAFTDATNAYVGKSASERRYVAVECARERFGRLDFASSMMVDHLAGEYREALRNTTF